MECIHNGRKHTIYSRVQIPKKKGEYVYFIRIGSEQQRLFKVGTANNIMRRMLEHCAYYKQPIYILWVSPNYSKYTTLRVEDRSIQTWKTFEGFQYFRNDRFVIDSSISKVTIKVKKEYEIALE